MGRLVPNIFKEGQTWAKHLQPILELDDLCFKVKLSLDILLLCWTSGMKTLWHISAAEMESIPWSQRFFGQKKKENPIFTLLTCFLRGIAK